MDGYTGRVQKGQPLNISAGQWSQTARVVDELINGQTSWPVAPNNQKDRPQLSSFQILYKAAEDVGAYKMITLDGAAIDSTQNEKEFLSRPRPTGSLVPIGDGSELPSYGAAIGPTKSGQYGKVAISGVVVLDALLPAESTPAQAKFLSTSQMAEAGILSCTNESSPYRILWIDPAAVPGEVTRVMAALGGSGGGGGDGQAIAVDMVQVGGSQGDGENMPSWTYDVYLASDRGNPDKEPILTAADPTDGWWRRHLGQMEPADFGWVYQSAENSYEITWINEILIAADCIEDDQGPDPPNP